jgi:Flp pilus assembly protein TadD
MAENSEKVAATSVLKEPQIESVPTDTTTNDISSVSTSVVAETPPLSAPPQSETELADDYKREEAVTTTERAKASEAPTAFSGGLASAPSPSVKTEMEAKKSKALQSATDKEADVSSRSTPNQDYYHLGMQYFNSGDYKSAENTFAEATRLNPNNLDALYFEGISSHINGNNAKAEQKFDQLLLKGSYTEGSKWYKAKILLKKGRKEEARKLLLELSGSTGIFKERADKQLEKLD